MQAILERCRVFVERPWFIVGVAFFAGADLFICIVPVEVFLVSAVLARPRRWLSAGSVTALGSALGACALAAVIGWDREWILAHVLPAGGTGETSRSIAALLDAHRSLAIGLVALSPFPQQPAVAAAALGGMPAVEIGACVLAGRLVKYLLVAWCAAFAPHLIARLSRKAVTSSPTRSRT